MNTVRRSVTVGEAPSTHANPERIDTIATTKANRGRTAIDRLPERGCVKSRGSFLKRGYFFRNMIGCGGRKGKIFSFNAVHFLEEVLATDSQPFLKSKNVQTVSRKYPVSRVARMLSSTWLA